MFKGTAVTLADWTLIYDPLEHWLASGDFTGTLPVALLSASILFLVLVHPNPLGPCPCFDDSVCFGGVIVGLTAGGMRTRGLDPNAGSNVGMSLGEAALRLVLGVFVLFLWRYAAKRALLTVLTPVWLRHGMPLVYHQIGLKTVGDNTMADLHGKDKPVDIVLSDAFESTMDTQSVSVSEQQLIRRHRNSCSKISGSTNADEEEVDALAMQLSDTYRECLEDICTSTYCIPRHSLDVVVKLIVYSGRTWAHPCIVCACVHTPALSPSGIAWLGTDLIPSAFALIFV